MFLLIRIVNFFCYVVKCFYFLFFVLFQIIFRHWIFWLFTLSFGFLEVLTSKYWVHILQYMKLSWQISIAMIMDYSFKITYLSLIFFLLCSHIFCLTIKLMWFKNYKLLLFKKKIHFYSIFYIVFYVTRSWILMNKLRLCVNLINLFFKFLLFKNQKGCWYVSCGIFLNYITWRQEPLSLIKNKSWNHK